MFGQLFSWLKQKSVGQAKPADSFSIKSQYAPEVQALSMSEDSEAWLEQARTFSGIQDWEKTRDCAGKAIRIAPNLVEGYMLRALALRVLGKLDRAIADYAKVIEINPQHGEAWMFRGACKAQKASLKPDHEQFMTLLNNAHPDYKRAAELMPEDEQAGLALLELEICACKYREAVSTTGRLWNRIQRNQDKLICAWLGCIAHILAGESRKKWVHLQEFLESEPTQLGPTEWSVAEIQGAIQKLISDGLCNPEKLTEIQNTHKSFLRHFSRTGPAIK